MAVNKKLSLSNDVQNLRAQCKVVVYNWEVEATGSTTDDSDLADSTALDISSQILAANFTKTLGSPAGSFSFTLSNSPGYGTDDWKDILKRGSWCVIYMTQDGDLSITDRVGPATNNPREAKRIRCIGFIDRVSVKAELDDSGAFDVVYEVTGRDFGVVYEDTTIWHNVFKFDQIMLQSIAETKISVISSITIDEVMKVIHNLFYNPKAIPGAKVNDNSSLLSIALQWLLPRRMLQDIGQAVDSTPYWGEFVNLNFSPTIANLAVSRPTDYLSGNAWENLKKISIPHFHELFTETSDAGLPQLVFRPIPFSIDPTNYPTLASKVQLYKDVTAIPVPALDVVDFNLGEDNHGRYNSFLATVQTSLIGIEDNVSILEPQGFPYFVQDSIKRYGFRPMHVTVDSFVKNGDKSDGKSNAKILTEYNWLLKDYWSNSVFSESGELSKIGRNDVKVGKCMTFDSSTPYIYGKRYYIEGYTDTFVVDDRGTSTWMQSVMLTRGFEEADLTANSNFDSRDAAFNQAGEYTPSGSASGKKTKS
jgi:hypothetical protein